MDMKKYCMIGSSEVIECLPHLKPDGYVEVLSNNPDPNLYILSHDGSWVIGVSYAEARRLAYEKEWPNHRQFEALVEFMSGKKEKFEELLEFSNAIRLKYPK